MEFSADETIEEEISNFFDSYLDEAKLHDAGCGNQIIPVQSFEEAIDRVLNYLTQTNNTAQVSQDSGVNYETPAELKTKIITQTYNSKIHLISGISDKDAQHGYFKSNNYVKSDDGYGINHLKKHSDDWSSFYALRVENNKFYKQKLNSYGINENNSNLKNMLLFAKYAIENGGCKNQQKRLTNGEHTVSIIYDDWVIVFGYNDTYLGANNSNDFTYLHTMYYLKSKFKSTDSQQVRYQKQKEYNKLQQILKSKNTSYNNAIKNKTHPKYNLIKAFDDSLKNQGK